MEIHLLCTIGVVVLGLTLCAIVLAACQYAYVYGPDWLVKCGRECSPFLPIIGFLSCLSIFSIVLFSILKINGF